MTSARIPNPSIEGTSSSKIRLLPAAPHVKRWALVGEIMEKQRVYSPTQAASGAFLGGPIASIVYLKQNFRALGNASGESKVLMYGAALVLLLLGVLPFLPDKFPNMAIPLATVIATRTLVEKYQVTKEAIVDSDRLEFHSNWRVFGVSLACMIAFLALALAVFLGLDALGIVIAA